MNLLKTSSKLSLLQGINAQECVVILSYVLLVVAGVFQTHFNQVFAYIDELLTLIMVGIYLLAIIRTRESSPSRVKLLSMLFIFIGIGGMSSIMSTIDRALSSVLVDLFTCSKFYLMFIASDRIMWKGSKRAVQACSRFASIYLMIMLACLPLAYFFNVGMIVGERPGYAFLYGHPSNFAASVVMCFVVILANGEKTREYALVCLILCVASDRMKAIAFAVVATVAVFLFNRKRTIPFSFWLMSALGSLIVAAGQIKLYFFDSSTARSVLTVSSIKVANRFFPLGSGFATYGSNVTIGDYSPLYYELGFEQIWGLSPIYNDYIADSFWPIVIAQFGYFGFIVFILLFAYFVRYVLVSAKKGCSQLLPAMLVVVYLLIASTSETAFFSSYAPGLALSLALALHVDSHDGSQESERDAEDDIGIIEANGGNR